MWTGQGKEVKAEDLENDIGTIFWVVQTTRGTKENMEAEKGITEAKEDLAQCHFGAKEAKEKVNHLRKRCVTSVEKLVILPSFAPRVREKETIQKDIMVKEEKQKQGPVTNVARQDIWQVPAEWEV